MVGKESACNAEDVRDVGLILGLGRSPGGGYGNPLQDSCLENPMDRGTSGVGAWVLRVSESDTTDVQLSTHECISKTTTLNLANLTLSRAGEVVTHSL